MARDIKADLLNQLEELREERGRLLNDRDEVRRAVGEDTTGTHAPVWHELRISRRIEKYDRAIENVERELDTLDTSAFDKGANRR